MGDFWPYLVKIYTLGIFRYSILIFNFRTPKSTLLRETASFELSRVLTCRRVTKKVYNTVSHKNGATFIFTITLANVDRFQ